MIKYTKEELGFIDHCFDVTLAHFVKNPLQRDNEADILTAINHRNYNIGSMGIDGHRIMHAILDKMGYCNDGKTTKDEAMQKELALETEKAAIWTKQRLIAIQEIDSNIEALIQMKRELSEHDQKFDNIVAEKEAVILKKFDQKMEEDRIDSQNKLIEHTQTKIEELNLRELRSMASDLKIKNYSRMAKADLIDTIYEVN